MTGSRATPGERSSEDLPSECHVQYITKVHTQKALCAKNAFICCLIVICLMSGVISSFAAIWNFSAVLSEKVLYALEKRGAQILSVKSFHFGFINWRCLKNESMIFYVLKLKNFFASQFKAVVRDDRRRNESTLAGRARLWAFSVFVSDSEQNENFPHIFPRSFFEKFVAFNLQKWTKLYPLLFMLEYGFFFSHHEQKMKQYGSKIYFCTVVKR